MSIWDHMKPAVARVEATDVALTEARELAITWSDGKSTPITFRKLRQLCPCAACVDEWTHERTLVAESVPVDIAIRQVNPVGNYALGITFGDGHSSGIYSWETLRQIGEGTTPELPRKP